jgi:hypothetical protein
MHGRLAAAAFQRGDDDVLLDRLVDRLDLAQVEALHRRVVVPLGDTVEAAVVAGVADLDRDLAGALGGAAAHLVDDRLRRRLETQAAHAGDRLDMVGIEEQRFPVERERGRPVAGLLGGDGGIDQRFDL